MIWCSLGQAAFTGDISVVTKSESLFLPINRLPYLHVDSKCKLACDLETGTLYDLQLGVRVKPRLTNSCCIESFRFLITGDYFCVLTVDRRKVLACRSSDEQRLAEFELFGTASCLEVVASSHSLSNRRVIVIGMDDGRVVALSFVADLVDPQFQHLQQFRKAT